MAKTTTLGAWLSGKLFAGGKRLLVVNPSKKPVLKQIVSGAGFARIGPKSVEAQSFPLAGSLLKNALKVHKKRKHAKKAAKKRASKKAAKKKPGKKSSSKKASAGKKAARTVTAVKAAAKKKAPQGFGKFGKSKQFKDVFAEDIAAPKKAHVKKKKFFPGGPTPKTAHERHGKKTAFFPELLASGRLPVAAPGWATEAKKSGLKLGLPSLIK